LDGGVQDWGIIGKKQTINRGLSEKTDQDTSMKILCVWVFFCGGGKGGDTWVSCFLATGDNPLQTRTEVGRAIWAENWMEWGAGTKKKKGCLFKDKILRTEGEIIKI